MVSRLKRIQRLKQGSQFAKQHIENADWTNAAVVQQALIEQLIALLDEDIGDQSDPGFTIAFKEVVDE